MRVSINQPAYLPWLGYFHRIAISDVHVVLDSVQLEKNSFTNRNRVLTRQGPRWLTVPVRTKGRFGDLTIRDVEILEEEPWRKKHWATLSQSYATAEHFPRYADSLRPVYEQPWSQLGVLNRHVTELLLDWLGVETKIVYSSELDVSGTKDELVLELCRAVGATSYLSGPLGRDYLREDLFAAHSIDVRYHDYRHPEYKQMSDKFESHLSVVDLLLNCGPDSLRILSENQPPAGPA